MLLAAEAQRRRELLFTAENTENTENYFHRGERGDRGERLGCTTLRSPSPFQKG